MVTRSKHTTSRSKSGRNSQPAKHSKRKSQGQKVLIKKGAQVPRVRILDPDKCSRRVYPLLGEQYYLGRSSRCEIRLDNILISHCHCSLRRDPANPQQFIIRDENSSNGLYMGRRRFKSHRLKHGDLITFGPPELVDAPQLRFLNPHPVWMKGFRLLLVMGLLGSLLSGAAMAVLWGRIKVKPMPTIVQAPVKVFAADRRTEISPIRQDIHREFDHLEEFSPYLPQAVIASEDTRFYWHLGVDPIGLARAIHVNRTNPNIQQGASTLTQQLARSLFTEVGRENTVSRKLREMFVALKLEAVYSKDEILRAYLNRVYLGAGNYGFEDAAQFYFDKSAKELDLGEAATLVAMLPAPNAFNPVDNYETTVEYRNRVIKRMAMLGMVDEQEANRARRSRIQVSPRAAQSLSSRHAPYFYSYVFGELNQLLGENVAHEGNFVVETSLNLPMQQRAEKTLRNFINTTGKEYQFDQGAIVTLDSRTGEILVMVGGKDYKESQFNRVTQAQRQPGSTFKLFTFTAAIAKGITENQPIECQALTWQGTSYKACERSGDTPAISLAQGFYQSENVVALRLAQQVSLKEVIDTAQKFGVDSQLKAEPGLVLGQSEVRLIDMTEAYGIIANNGQWQRPHGIRQIRDAGECTNSENLFSCREIYHARKNHQQRKIIISPAIAQRVTKLLQGAVQAGTGSPAQLGMGEAGKTGTTDNGVDMLFIGFIPQKNLVTGVWLGNDDSSPTKGTSAQAASLWRQYMQQILPLS